MKTSAGTARAVHRTASRRPVTVESAKKSAARTPSDPTTPAVTRVEKLDPSTRKKTAWRQGVNGPNQYTTSR
ncbi:MAG: hypothetical protein DMF55_02445 [Acidobacteria bacterium]|nr:MAG: hypothetical protein DMF55_02445 [Acidobacteriota bacterium]